MPEVVIALKERRPELPPGRVRDLFAHKIVLVRSPRRRSARRSA
ncbi:hypothetical protein [Burkholderia sp. Bp9140]|nr:hypothetical protein [Burkholderia sp. Bp9140]